MKNVYLFTLLLLKEKFRTIFYKNRANCVQFSSISTVKVLITLTLIVLWVLLIPVYKQMLGTYGYFSGNLHIFYFIINLSIVALGFISSLLLNISQNMSFDKSQINLPIKKSNIFLPYIIIQMIELGLYFLFLAYPLFYILSNNSFLSSLQLFINKLLLLFLSTFLFYASLLFIKKRNVSKIKYYSTYYLGIILTVVIILFVILYKNEFRITTISVISSINSFLPFHESLFHTFIYILLLIPSILSVSYLTIVIYQEAKPKTKKEIFNTSGLFRYSGLFAAFLYRDLLFLKREIKVIINSISFLIIISLFFYFFSKKALDVVISISIYFIPFHLYGQLLIHSFGRESNQINLIRLTNPLSQIYFFRSIAATISIFFLTILHFFLLSAVMYFLNYDLFILNKMMIVFYCIILSVVVGNGISVLFGIFNYKKIFIERGITISGELIFWCIGGAYSFLLNMLEPLAVSNGGLFLLFSILILSPAILIFIFGYLRFESRITQQI